MLKVTIKLPSCLFFYCTLALGCGPAAGNEMEKDAALHRADSLSEARIDSAYKAIGDSCDSMKLHLVPRFVVSLVKGDTAYLDKYFNSKSLFIDINKKVEKIVRQLQADCDSNLLREVYKMLPLRKRKRPIKGKGKEHG